MNDALISLYEKPEFWEVTTDSISWETMGDSKPIVSPSPKAKEYIMQRIINIQYQGTLISNVLLKSNCLKDVILV